jgi:hypothetical protein
MAITHAIIVGALRTIKQNPRLVKRATMAGSLSKTTRYQVKIGTNRYYRKTP